MNHLQDLVGVILEEDMVSEQGAVLLPKGRILTEQDVAMAAKHQLLSAPRYRMVAVGNEDVFREVGCQVNEIFQFARTRGNVPLDAVRNHVAPFILEVTEHVSLAKLLQQLHTKDDYTVRHSIGVGVLSTLMGKWLDLSDDDLLDLAIAATVHDVGKMKISAAILNKPAKLSPNEYSEMQKHTEYGYELIRATEGATERQALAALQHHEREDGSGYPAGIAGGQISFFAKVIGIADIFHAMSSKRVYHEALPFYQVLTELQSGAYGKFDSKISRLFLERMMETMMGEDVLLTDGRRGKIVMIYAADPVRPLVQVEKNFINLSTDYTIHIDRVIGE